ncbi:helix-hairpin-helix domain-containing protein [Spirosoma utsteinense]|uniref:DNA polymerase (Family 10) n=1 Tax=Spirosoma utsteinense TaxID=2585773 RepID=A0ABR6W7L4_9BACT|nr:helix-hairpin-helix domain-containing protein [Spirosoma utsteinense]MBC3783942.1 DNA polymerase (family 10) [Spirosoma utsteinense]MBC3792576.1 DNA polymerase (family 10) [Spirosoma utsteinense]
MTNAEIVDLLELTGRLMELHEQDAFRTRTFTAAAFNLDKSTADLANLPVEELVKLPGVGKSLAGKIREIAETGRLTELDELLAQTPSGVMDMFRIKGLGVKKIGTLWRELGIETIPDLQQACETGRVAKIKGFGVGTQDKILAALEFLQEQQGKVRMDKAAMLANLLHDLLAEHFDRVEISGQVRRKAQEVDTVQLLVQTSDPVSAMLTLNSLPNLEQNKPNSSPFAWRGRLKGFDVGVELLLNSAEQTDRQLFIQTAAEPHLQQVGAGGMSLLQAAYTSQDASEAAIYERAGLPYIVPEMREDDFAFRWAARYHADDLVTWDDLRGTLHNHSTWSDGKQSVADMANYCRELGLTYFGIADHSKTASYAGGLDAERVRQQQLEIDQLNLNYGSDFRIFKGIESDILGDGSLDYDEATLATFDYVVASVHQTLTMSIEKATSRLLRAIENPYTTILGHPTGRLLLAREGYPIDHKVIIDACAEHNVIIEINASPYRLDIDWRWIDYAMQQGVMLSINPDAHDFAGLLDMHYGVAIGRKGGLIKKMTFNALTLSEIASYFQERRAQIGKK